MEVKAGYKQTEVGVIPEDWDCVKLKQIALIQRGASPRPIDSPIWFDENSKTGWLRISDVSKSKKYLFDTTQNLSSAGISNSRFVESDNLVMSICATVGRPIITRKNVCIHDGFVVFNNLSAAKEYLYYVLSDLESSWTQHGQTGSQMNLNTNLINSTSIPLPPTKAEQTAIATALSDVDEWIAAQELLIQKKRRIKEGAMQQLLTGKKRLEGFGRGAGVKQTEVGVIPEDWEVKPIGEVVDKNIKWSFTGGPFGSNLKSSDYTDDGIRIIQLQNIGDGTFINDYQIYTSLEKADELISCNIYPGDIIFSKMGDPVARACIIPDYNDRYVMCSDGIRFVVDKKKYDSIFFYYQINHPIFRNLAESASTGSTRKRIGLSELRSLLIFLPPSKTEQTAIAGVLSDMDEEIAELEAKLEKTRELKQGMMQQLLTGKIRLV